MRARAFDRLRGGAVSVLIASALALHACSKEGSALPGGKTKADQAGVPVVTAQVVRKTMPAKLQAIGNVEPRTSVAVKSRIDGQIIAVRFQDGQDVGKDQLLFELDPRALDAQVKQLRSHRADATRSCDQCPGKERRYAESAGEGLHLGGRVQLRSRPRWRRRRRTCRPTGGTGESPGCSCRYTRIIVAHLGRAGKIMIQIGNVVKANDTAAGHHQRSGANLCELRGAGAVPVRRSAASWPRARFRCKHPAGCARRRRPIGRAHLHRQRGGRADRDDPAASDLPEHDHVLWPGQFVNVTLMLRRAARRHRDSLPGAAERAATASTCTWSSPDQSAEMRSVTVDRTDGSGGRDRQRPAGRRDGGHQRADPAHPGREGGAEGRLARRG